MPLKSSEKVLYRQIEAAYRKATRKKTSELADVVDWAMGEGKLELPEDFAKKFHRERLSEALRTDEESFRLPNGKTVKVRLRHCLEKKSEGADGQVRQQFLWGHVDTAPHAFLLEALHQRKRAVKDHIDSLKYDIEFVNARLVQRGLTPLPTQALLDFTDGAAGVAV